MNEDWKPVEGYDAYEVSNLGRVRSLDRKAGNRFVKGRVLKPQNGSHGYLTVSLSKDSVVATRTVHTLVARAFLGQPPEGMIVLHGPDGCLDNSLTNLSYGTPSKNMQDKKRDGTDSRHSQTHCSRGHLLKGVNLAPSGLRRGKRSCVACMNGRAFMKYRESMGEEFTPQAENDVYFLYYQKVMSKQPEEF